MAYRKAAPKRATKSGNRGGYGKGAGGSGYRAAGNKRGTASRSGSGVQTVRIVIEQPASSSVARPATGAVTVEGKRKSPF